MSELFLFVAYMFFCFRRVLRYLQLYQQEEYQGVRFIKRLVLNRAYDTRATVCILLVYAGSWFFLPLESLLAVVFFVLALFEEDPRKTGKLPLKMTERARAILYIALVLQAGAYMLFPAHMLALVVLVQLLPLFLPCANAVHQPYERRKQARFLAEARKILEEVSPFIIGITGSFGKTSTKYALAKVLQVTLGSVFWPPRSYNTVMGITREIRERLVKGHTYAIIEMGAYTIGSIRKLCAFTPPKAAIITGVGTCHLDRFGSPENIVTAKSELAEALPPDGILVCNADNDGARAIAERFALKRTFFYGFDNSRQDLDCLATDIHFSERGTHFKLYWKGVCYDGFTPLFGRTALSNVLAAYTMACALGADPEFVLATIATLEPVDNRLQVKKRDGSYFVHDAFNSNPAGFAAALEVLQALPAKRRIVMTPGMIELGPDQARENSAAAQRAGQVCDLALIVGETNQEWLTKGFKEAGLPDDKIICCKTRDAAFERLFAITEKDDCILIENDLTDIYEYTAKF